MDRAPVVEVICAMEDGDFDPIHIDTPSALDRRFAKFDFSTDNSPRHPDNSITLSGSVGFGKRHQTGQEGRVYFLGVKSAFLEVLEVGCRFEPNVSLQEQLQKGVLKERATSSHSKGDEISAGFGASVKTDLSNF